MKTEQYRLMVDGEPMAPFRRTIQEAAWDALNTGFASPDEQGRIVLHASAEIEHGYFTERLDA